MILPQTYRDRTYDVTVTAVNADTILDYNGVVKACDNILSVSKDGMDKVASNIEKVQLGKETLCVQDSSLEPIVDEVGQYLKSLPELGIEPALEEIKAMALEAHDQLQTIENEKANAEYVSRRNQAIQKAQAANNN